MSSKIRLAALLGVAAVLAAVAFSRLKPKEEPPVAGGVAALPTVDALLLRELPRQVLAIAAERQGVPLSDRTLAPRSKPDANAVAVTSEWRVGSPFRLRFALKGQPAGEFETPLAYGPGETIPYDRIATALAPLIEAGVAVDALNKAGGKAALPMTDKPAPAGVEAMANRVNYFDAFRAARLTHAAVEADGESPARLSALARAYANLGESTRPLLTSHFDTFFARALLYAERLVITRPNEAASYWTRAYVRSMVGLANASDDVAKARSLAGDTPAWADAVAAFSKGDTAALFGAIGSSKNAGTATVAAHFATRTVALSGLESVAIRFANLSLSKDPTDFYDMLMANDNSGVSNHHLTTAAMPIAINRGYAAIDAWPELPAEIRKAVASARAKRFDADSRLALWSALDAQPADANPLPWSTLADLARETTVIVAGRRLDFLANDLGVDASDELSEWWPLVKDHPAAELLASYARDVDVAKLRKLEVYDLHSSINRFLTGPTSTSWRVNPVAHDWLRIRQGHFDTTPYQFETVLWYYNYNIDRGDSTLIAHRLFAAAPQDVIGLSGMVRDDWAGVSAMKDELLAKAASSPQLGWRLAEHELAEGKADEAIDMLQGVLKTAPDARVYRSLASCYRAKGDVEGYVRSREAYLQNGEDFGLDHAQAQVDIAEALILAGDAKRALPYSSDAAQSGAAWAMEVYADNLARLDRVAEAKAVLSDIESRYGEFNRYDAWFAGFVFPKMSDPAAAAWAQQQVQAWEVPTAADNMKRRAAVFYIMDGKLDKAAQVLETEQRTEGAIGLTSLAAVNLMRDDTTNTLETLDRIDATDPHSLNAVTHLAAAKHARDILNGGKMVTPEQATDVVRNEASDNSKSTAAALVGLACEKKGDKGAAELWYRCAERFTGVGAGRVIAAIQLKKAGLDPQP